MTYVTIGKNTPVRMYGGCRVTCFTMTYVTIGKNTPVRMYGGCRVTCFTMTFVTIGKNIGSNGVVIITNTGPGYINGASGSSFNVIFHLIVFMHIFQ